MKKKNLLSILPSNTTGGAEKILLSYFNGVEPRPFLLNLFILKKGKPLKIRKTNVFEFQYSRFLYAIPRLLFTIKKKKINILFSTFPLITVILIITKLLKFHNCTTVIRQPNMLMSSLNASIKLKLIKIIYLSIINFSDAIIVTSKAMLKEALQNKIIREKIFLLNNPIEQKDLRKNLKPFRTSGPGLKLVFVGRLTYQKGIDRVINILSFLKNVEFLIIGKGEQETHLKNIVRKNNLEKKVSFIGFKKKPFKYIAGADYFLLPSRWEGMPNCVLESLALGTPVIAFKDLVSLYDFEANIKNKSITLTENNDTLTKLLRSLKSRNDSSKPKLRKSLLYKPMSEKLYNRKLDKIILNSLCKKKRK